MTIYAYCPCFDITAAVIGFDFSLTVQHEGTGTSVTITTTELLSAPNGGAYRHHAPSGVNVGDVGSPWEGYKPFGDAVQSALNDNATSGDFSGSTWTVSWSETTTYYTISNNNESFTLTFNEINTRKILGFSGNKTSAQSQVGDRIPSYLIKNAIDERTAYTRPREVTNISSQGVSSDGKVHPGLSRGTVPKEVSWVQPHEPLAATFFAEIDTSDRYWTWENFYLHTRVAYPVLLVTSSTTGEVHMLKASSSSFRPEPLPDDNHEYWQIPFKTFYLGAAEQ
jgi:hypothetical protein